MIIAVASGKGGTGKTTVAVNLASVRGRDVTFADCDVEEPNGHLFLKPEIRAETEARVLVPRIDEDKCTLCGKCIEICPHDRLVELSDIVLKEKLGLVSSLDKKKKK